MRGWLRAKTAFIIEKYSMIYLPEC